MASDRDALRKMLDAAPKLGDTFAGAGALAWLAFDGHAIGAAVLFGAGFVINIAQRRFAQWYVFREMGGSRE